jgi:hypothetical protein
VRELVLGIRQFKAESPVFDERKLFDAAVVVKFGGNNSVSERI